MRIETLLNNKNVVTLKIEENKIYYLNFEIDIVETKDNAVHLFRETLRKLQIGEIIIMNGISKGEISTFVEVLEKLSKREAPGSAGDEWSKIEHIMIKGVKNVENEEEEGKPEIEEERQTQKERKYSTQGGWERCDKSMSRCAIP